MHLKLHFYEKIYDFNGSVYAAIVCFRDEGRRK